MKQGRVECCALKEDIHACVVFGLDAQKIV